jgi:hypothetical protein
MLSGAVLPLAGMFLFLRIIKNEDISEYGEEERALILKKNNHVIKIYKLGGWCFLIPGSIFLISTLLQFFGSETTNVVDGMSRNDLSNKVVSSIFAFMFPAIGALFVFTPKSRFENTILRLQHFTDNLTKPNKTI